MTAVVGVDLGGTNLRVAAVVDGAITASARRVLGDRRGVADVLAAIANRLRQHVRDSDTVARVGGDEFLYLLVDPQGPTNVERIAAQIVAYLAAPVAGAPLTPLLADGAGHAPAAVQVTASGAAVVSRWLELPKPSAGSGHAASTARLTKNVAS